LAICNTKVSIGKLAEIHAQPAAKLASASATAVATALRDALAAAEDPAEA